MRPRRAPAVDEAGCGGPSSAESFLRSRDIPASLPPAAAVAADLAAALTFLALIVGGVVGLRRYRLSLRIKAAELLLQLEEEFREVLPACVQWDTLASYRTDVAPVLVQYMEDGSLSDLELQRLAAVDRSLRFFYLCTVLHHDLGIEQDIVARSYYWFASQLLEREKRPELHRYVASHYRRLHDWLLRHEPCFRHYRARGIWDPRLARGDDEIAALRSESAE